MKLNYLVLLILIIVHLLGCKKELDCLSQIEIATWYFYSFNTEKDDKGMVSLHDPTTGRDSIIPFVSIDFPLKVAELEEDTVIYTFSLRTSGNKTVRPIKTSYNALVYEITMVKNVIIFAKCDDNFIMDLRQIDFKNDYFLQALQQSWPDITPRLKAIVEKLDVL